MGSLSKREAIVEPLHAFIPCSHSTQRLFDVSRLIMCKFYLISVKIEGERCFEAFDKLVEGHLDLKEATTIHAHGVVRAQRVTTNSNIQ